MLLIDRENQQGHVIGALPAKSSAAANFARAISVGSLLRTARKTSIKFDSPHSSGSQTKAGGNPFIPPGPFWALF